MTDFAQGLTVGEVADRYGITVRTLHHYDAVGLLVPGARTAAGYRLYTGADLARLQQIVVYRRLGLSLEDIASLVDDPAADATGHLQRQRQAVAARVGELHDLLAAIDRALEAEMDGTQLTPQEQRNLFGDGFEEHLAEAEERWGDTDAWRQSQERTAAYTRADWEVIQAEDEAITVEFIAALRAGEPATGERAMAAAEAHRLHLHERFHDISPEGHRRLGEMFVSDPRFTKTYDDRQAGLAAYISEAFTANAARHAG